MGQRLRMDEAPDRLVERDTGGDEDGQHDGEPRELLAADAAQEERDSERHRGQRVAEVVDQIREQRDRVRQQEDEQLRDGGEAEDEQAERDGLDAFARADDRAVHEPVRVAVPVVVPVLVVVAAHRSMTR